jgi:hypothetical protein
MEYTNNENFVKFIQDASIQVSIRYISTKIKDVLEIENIYFYSDNKRCFLEIGSWELDKNQQQSLKHLDINTVSRTTIQYSATDTFSSKPIDDHLININQTTIVIKTHSYTVYDNQDRQNDYSKGLYYKTTVPDTRYPALMRETIDVYSPDLIFLTEVIKCQYL